MRLSTVNAAIKQYGYELVKGKDYFYFMPLDADTPLLNDDSVMTYTLGKNLDFWLDELKAKIENRDKYK